MNKLQQMSDEQIQTALRDAELAVMLEEIQHMSAEQLEQLLAAIEQRRAQLSDRLPPPFQEVRNA